MGSQIETKRMFSVTRILTSLRRCWLGSKNLDLLVFFIKNYHDDPTIGIDDKRWNVGVDGFGEVEEAILDVMDVEFLEEVQDHLEDCLQDWEMYPWVLVVFYSWHIHGISVVLIGLL